MPIKGLTDRKSLRPRLPHLGKLRKGSPKKKNARGQMIYGDDLNYFRFTSDNLKIAEAFKEIYGDEPRVINIVMYYATYEECFPTWIEAWDGSGLVFRSDGENWHIWREGDKYQHGEKPHRDMPDQSETGRLEFVIPELWERGFRGTITLETHSNHDLRNIGGILLAAEQAQLARGESLRECPFILRRVQREISVPGWGERKGKRSKVKKWLCILEPPHRLLLGTPEIAALPATIDSIAGEIIEGEALTPKVSPPKPTTTKHPTSYDAAIVAAVIEAGLTENAFSFAGAMKKANLPATASKDVALDWFQHYRDARDADASSDEAAIQANAWWDGEGKLAEVMAYTTDSGKELRKMGAEELTGMVEKIDGLDLPISAKMRMLKEHCLVLIEYLAQAEEVRGE